jgi:putative FmdB family regulatory protein
MPIYEYQCQQCGRREEALQKMADPPLQTCAVCGGALKRLISKTTMHFKGSGWYVTDYARKGGATAKGEGESKGDAAKGESAAAESKPAAGSDASAGSGAGASAGSSTGSGSSSGPSSGSGSGSS